jgi:hypothetical protein
MPLSLCLAAALLLQAAPTSIPQEPAAVDDLTPPGNGEPVRIEVGIYLVDLISVDGSDQSFRADAVVHLLWKDPRLANATFEEARAVSIDDAWHPRIEVVNRRSIDATLNEELTVAPDGTVSYSQRYLGTFSSPMNLRQFPLDRQRFFIHVVVGHAGDRRVDVVTPQDPRVLVGRNEELSISDWRIGEARLEERPLRLSPNVEIAGIAMVMEGARELRYYIVQVILPLMMIVTMAWTVFWVDPAVVPTRVGTVVTTMLTLIAYRFALSSLVPRLPYLTRLDWFMLGSSSLILGTLLAMAASAYNTSKGNDATVQRIDRFGRVGFAVTALLIWTLPWLL